MFYTNGVILIHKSNDEEALKEACRKVTDFMEEKKGFQVIFDINNDHGFPSTDLPEGVDYAVLQEILSPYVSLKAINEDTIFLAGEQKIEEKHIFLPEELKEIADQMSRTMKDVEEKERSKKAASKKYADEIEELQNKIIKLNDQYSEGREYRPYQTKVKLNFRDGKKYFVDAHDESIVRRTVPMDAQEKQLRIDHTAESGFSTKENFEDTEGKEMFADVLLKEKEEEGEEELPM